MLKFFNKIRQQLIKEHKPASPAGKYLFYGLGEIILVVIGILIALQMNNWNQSRSNNKIAADYLNNLRTELNSDLDYFNQLQTHNKSQKTFIDEVLTALISKKVTPTEELELMFKLSEAMNPSDFFPKTATYQDLVTSGKMSLIKPVNFRQKIISHYNLMEQKSLHINRELDYSWNHLIPFLNDKGFFEWRNYPLIALDSSLVPKSTRLSILDLDKSSTDFEALENNLFFAKLMLTVRNQNLDELIQSTGHLIEVITQEALVN